MDCELTVASRSSKGTDFQIHRSDKSHPYSRCLHCAARLSSLCAAGDEMARAVTCAEVVIKAWVHDLGIDARCGMACGQCNHVDRCADIENWPPATPGAIHSEVVGLFAFHCIRTSGSCCWRGRWVLRRTAAGVLCRVGCWELGWIVGGRVRWAVCWVSRWTACWIVRWAVSWHISWVVRWAVSWISRWVVSWVVRWVVRWVSRWSVCWIIRW